MKKRGIGDWGLVATLLVLSAALPHRASAQDEDVGIAVGKTPPAAVIEDLDGKPVDLSRYVGRGPVLVEFWATWCPICRALLPRMEAAHDRYGKQVTFLVVAVAVNESQASIKRHMVQNPMPFPVLWDANGNATRAFEAPATSYVVILNAKGAVAYTGTGSDQDLDGALAKALQP